MDKHGYLRDFGIRVRIAREKAQKTQAEVAQACGYSTGAAISMIEDGKKNIPLLKIVAIAAELGVNPGILAFGEGMAIAEPARDEQIISLLTVFLGLNADGRKTALEFVESLHKAPRYKGK
jgi:transcriptional regulator with XRE-family HTH domain